MLSLLILLLTVACSLAYPAPPLTWLLFAKPSPQYQLQPSLQHLPGKHQSECIDLT